MDDRCIRNESEEFPDIGFAFDDNFVLEKFPPVHVLDKTLTGVLVVAFR